MSTSHACLWLVLSRMKGNREGCRDWQRGCATATATWAAHYTVVNYVRHCLFDAPLNYLHALKSALVVFSMNACVQGAEYYELHASAAM